MTKTSGSTESYPVAYPAGRRAERLLGAARFPATVLTRPGAALYGWGARALRQHRLKQRPPARGAGVISIGNLEVGGNGKTPFAILVIRHLLSRGFKPVYVSRGFKSAAERLQPVTVCLPTGVGGERPLPDGVRVVAGRRNLAAEIGDEGAMLAMRCPEIALLFTPARARAVDLAIDWLGATHVVLDDAFQTWGVARDLDIVLLDGRRPFGNGRLVPAGTLREEPAALSRAGLIGVNSVGESGELAAAADTIRSAAGRAVPVFGLRRGINFVDGTGQPTEVPQGACASLSSIARPGGFDRMLADAGVALATSIRYPDHHAYRGEDVQTIDKLIERAGVTRVVTTEKDWVKLRELSLPFACAIARLDLLLEGADVLPIIEEPQALRPAAP